MCVPYGLFAFSYDNLSWNIFLVMLLFWGGWGEGCCMYYIRIRTLTIIYFYNVKHLYHKNVFLNFQEWSYIRASLRKVTFNVHILYKLVYFKLFLYKMSVEDWNDLSGCWFQMLQNNLHIKLGNKLLGKRNWQCEDQHELFSMWYNLQILFLLILIVRLFFLVALVILELFFCINWYIDKLEY